MNPQLDKEAAAFEAAFPGYKAMTHNSTASRAAGKVVLKPSNMFRVWQHFRFSAAIDITTFEVDITLEIVSEGEDQIVSRPVGEGYTYKDLEGSRVRFASQESEVGAVPAGDPDTEGRNTYGWCESVELTLAATTFAGESINLGTYRDERTVERAKAAIIASINP